MTEPTEGFDAEAGAQEFQHLSRQNEETLKVIAGRGFQVPPPMLTAWRVELVLDALFGAWGETTERLQFELSWQKRLQAHLAEVLNETAGQSLIVPSNNNGPAKGLHLP